MPIKPQPSHKPIVRQAGAALPLPVVPIIKPVPVRKAPTPNVSTPYGGNKVSLSYPSTDDLVITSVSALKDPTSIYFPSQPSSELANKINGPRTIDPKQQDIIDVFNATTYSKTKPFEVFFHRSGHETYWRCPRAYYLNYHYLGTGIYKAPIPLHLEVGSAVHLGFASILKGHTIERSVNVAQQYLQHGERFPFLNTTYEQQEQLALIAGLLYSFWFYMWPSFQKQFKVLYVERGVVVSEIHDLGNGEQVIAHRMSRPDAVLQDRSTGEVVGWSLKTINDLNEWKRMQFHNDLQGLTEMYNAEVMFEQIAAAGPDAFVESWLDDLSIKPTYAQIKEKIAEWDTLPTNVDYIQTLFLVKGQRKPFGEQDEVGIFDPPSDDEKEFRQHSPLCYYWRNNGSAPIGSPPHSWASRYYKDGNKSYNRLGKGFDRVPVWTNTQSVFLHPSDIKELNQQVSEWVQQMNTQKVHPSTLSDDRNIKNPLSQIVVYDDPMYRDRTHMQNVVERQVAKVQHRITFDLYDIHKLMEVGQVESTQELVDQYFDQHLVSCRQPYRCEFQKLCHETAEGWMDHKSLPEGYSVRKPHHEFEVERREGK